MKFLFPLIVIGLLLSACTPKPTQPILVGLQANWTAEQVSTDADGMPLTKVHLFADDKEVFVTSCNGVATADKNNMQDVGDALAAVQCWWAGGGDQYGAFQVGNTVVVRHRTVDEEGGFGEWETLKTVQ